MKNNILIFLLGVFVTISIAATVPNTELLTVKPATPKSVFTILCYNNDEAVRYIEVMSQKGYKYISFSGANSSNGVLVMEKY